MMILREPPQHERRSDTGHRRREADLRADAQRAEHRIVEDMKPVEYSTSAWLRAVKRHHGYVLIHHPHHYVTAALFTIGLFVTGHWELGAAHAAWLYAFTENIATAAEVVAGEAP